MVWGLVWMTCFALNHFHPLQYRWIWGLGNATGILATLVAVKGAGPAVTGPSERRMTWKFLWLWISLIVFLNTSIAIMSAELPGPGQKIAAFVALGIMFVYIIIGLMLDAGFMIGLGLSVMVLTIIGFFALHGYFYLWMSGTSGLAMFLSGIYVHRRWR